MMPSLTPQRAVTPLNVVRTMNFRTIRPILRSEIPVSTRKHRVSLMRELQVVKDFGQMLDQTNASGLNPCEIVGEIDITGTDVHTLHLNRK